MIPLMKNAFYDEHKCKEELAQFILKSDRLSMSQQCADFEMDFAKFQGAKEAVLVNSGGSANLAMLQTLKNLGKLKDGDKVGFSALTWSTNVMPIIQLGMQPVPVDCDPKTLNVMSDNLLSRLKETDMKAFFITNALGFSGDLDRIKQICIESDIILLEDNCEALGTELASGKTGTFGEISSFSFFVAHHMSTIEGGMLCTDNEDYAEMLRIVRANGWDRNLKAKQQAKWRKAFKITSELEAKYTFYDLGFNIRPTEITGFLGRYQLEFITNTITNREHNYRIMAEVVKDNDELITLDRSHISLLSAFAFPVLCKTKSLREKYISQFAGAGIEIRPMIAGNIQKQPFFTKYVDKKFELIGTDIIDECGFYCGNYPELNEADLQTICSCLGKY